MKNQSGSLLFSETKLGSLTLKNRITMAPMTRSRATSDHVPTPIMAEYYAQRASAGLLITEGTAPSKNGAGYARIPGIYSDAQIAGWRRVTDAVHSRGGRIFVQLMHTGRVSHPANLDSDAEVLAPSAVKLPGETYTDAFGMREYPTPREMTATDVETTIEEFVQAGKNAIRAGFDGVEIHGANGYLIEQFLRVNTNLRKDVYGGSIEGRARFLLEVVRRTGDAIGFDRVGVRLSPYGKFNDMGVHPEMTDDYVYLSRELSRLGIVYLHLIDHPAADSTEVPEKTRLAIREAFRGTIMSAGGYDVGSGEEDLRAGLAHLISIGKPFIGNPDLVERLRNGTPLNAIDFSTLYSGGEKGYTDYPITRDEPNPPKGS